MEVMGTGKHLIRLRISNVAVVVGESLITVASRLKDKVSSITTL